MLLSNPIMEDNDKLMCDLMNNDEYIYLMLYTLVNNCMCVCI